MTDIKFATYSRSLSTATIITRVTPIILPLVDIPLGEFLPEKIGGKNPSFAKDC
jgi:hypothetical protein